MAEEKIPVPADITVTFVNELTDEPIREGACPMCGRSDSDKPVTMSTRDVGLRALRSEKFLDLEKAHEARDIVQILKSAPEHNSAIERPCYYLPKGYWESIKEVLKNHVYTDRNGRKQSILGLTNPVEFQQILPLIDAWVDASDRSAKKEKADGKTEESAEA